MPKNGSQPVSSAKHTSSVESKRFSTRPTPYVGARLLEHPRRVFTTPNTFQSYLMACEVFEPDNTK